ncbi:MAG: serine acetyltransferase [Candidatus Ornithomonoglobus sp.]
MIHTRQDLREYLSYEKDIYTSETKKDRILDIATHMPNRLKRKYVYLLRKTEFYYNNRKNPFYGVMYLITRNRKNRLGEKLGVEIFENSFDKGLTIYHTGNIVINGDAKIGKNCRLHGSNCIGNNGKDFEAPVIGDNVSLGVGAKVIGGITIADNIKIGAGAVVLYSFEEPGITIGGIPARKLK